MLQLREASIPVPNSESLRIKLFIAHNNRYIHPIRIVRAAHAGEKKNAEGAREREMWAAATTARTYE